MGLKVLALPLLILGVLSVLSYMGLGSVVSGDATFTNLGQASAGGVDGFVDATGRQIAYANGTVLAGVESGTFGFDYRANPPYGTWLNSSGFYELTWSGSDSASGGLFSMSGGVAVFAVLMVVVGMAILTGFHILGSGTTDTGVSAVIKGSFFAFIFALLASQGGVLLASVPVVGSVALMGLSVLYLVGVVDMFGHPSGA